LESLEIDGFRFIKSLHTTARQLFVSYNILAAIGQKQIPKDLLESIMKDWSFKMSQSNDFYYNRKGKLTEGEKATTAFSHYLNLCESLNLVTSLNSIYACTRLTEILLSLKSEKDAKTLSVHQKVFFLYQLLTLDADGILLVLQMLKSSPNGLSQKELQKEFKASFNLRLTVKRDKSKDRVRSLISEQYRLLNYSWQNPEKYSEHLLVPRCEWLSELNLIKVVKVGGSNNYSLNEIGSVFFDSIPREEVSDISESWIRNHLFKSFAKIYNGQRELFQNLSTKAKSERLGNSLVKFKNSVKLSNTFRYPLTDSLLFISMDNFSDNVIIEFEDVLTELKLGFTYNGYQYSLNDTGRANESYISIQLER